MADAEVDAGTHDAVSYRALLTDPALVTVLLISGTAAFGNNAVPVTLPVIGHAFGLGSSAIGLVMSTFALAVLVSIPVISVLADVYGRRAVVIPALLLFGVAGTATLFVSSFPALLALRAVQGAAFSGTLPLTPVLTGDLYTGAAGSSAQGFRSGLNGLTGAVAPLVASVLALVAWQYPFVLFALAFPVAGLVYRYYPEPVEVRGPPPGGMGGALRDYAAGLRAAADRRLAVFMAGGFTLFFLKAGFTTFLPVFVVSGLGAPVTAAGTILGGYGGTRVVVSPLSGSVMARLGRKRTILLGTVVAAVGIAAIPLSASLPALGVAAAVFAVGEAMLNPVLNDAVALAAVAEQRAGVMGGLQVLKNVSLTVGPVLLGAVIATAGFTAAFFLAATVGVGYALAVVVGLQPTVTTATGR